MMTLGTSSAVVRYRDRRGRHQVRILSTSGARGPVDAVVRAEREDRMLTLEHRGHSVRQIALALGICDRTVERWRARRRQEAQR